MNCPQIVLNFIKYLAFSLSILYTLDQNKQLKYYLERSIIIGACMVVVEYLIKNICRDVKEKFTTTGPGISEEDDEGEMLKEEVKDDKKEDEQELNKLIEESMKEMDNEKEKIEEDIEEDMDEKQEIEYGYSYVHPDAMKLPEIRLPKIIQNNECSVCPIMMGGTADLLEIKPRKKPIKGC